MSRFMSLCRLQEVFRAVLYADLDFERPPWDIISQDARALIAALLQRDADRRPTAREALSFRYEGTLCGASSVGHLSSHILWSQRYGEAQSSTTHRGADCPLWGYIQQSPGGITRSCVFLIPTDPSMHDRV